MEIKKIYFDMDGVLADFDGGVLEYCGFPNISQNDPNKPEGFDNKLWAEIKKVGHFYWHLKPMPGAIEMFNTLYEKYGDKVEILTGIPKPKRGILTAKEDKEAWVSRHLSEKIIVNVVYREEKTDFAGEGKILIDDYLKNVDEWENAGGIGIAFESAEKVLARIAEIEKA